MVASPLEVVWYRCALRPAAESCATLRLGRVYRWLNPGAWRAVRCLPSSIVTRHCSNWFHSTRREAAELLSPRTRCCGSSRSAFSCRVTAMAPVTVLGQRNRNRFLEGERMKYFLEQTCKATSKARMAVACTAVDAIVFAPIMAIAFAGYAAARTHTRTNSTEHAEAKVVPRGCSQAREGDTRPCPVRLRRHASCAGRQASLPDYFQLACLGL